MNLQIVKSQLAQKTKDRRILQLTIEEFGGLPNDADIRFYRGVGKM
jgi:hypothetical protein